ncbi:hypothetical protein LLS1_04160 [Leifsonia sp. LS1]|uniref:hypothetical protein n=1 Tax=Leifsonia sp. LS1 TaxID=2828483 RepID=UPI001CFD28A7|nr:hypothetical protein [Leifsonia sp. LS1]GIT78747.1 hypothetical protein LLS1_04160 [Leifsonia sp. LS1]
MMHTTTLRDDVAAFAAAVRSHLSDLPADDVDDLTDGLEADLLEQAEDNDGALTADDPGQYASELRASAGLPERAGSAAAPTLRERVGESVARMRGEASRLARSSRFGAWLTDFLLALRPAWWVFRGWAVYVVGWLLFTGQARLLPTQILGWVVLGASVLVSVQWGRGRWLPQRWLTYVRLLASVVAVLAAPFVVGGLASAVNDSGSYAAGPVDDLPPQGLTLDGSAVTNIFGYDADGRPLDHIQLFDQNGAPLVTVGGDSTGLDADPNTSDAVVPVPYAKIGSTYVWNVYPLRVAPLDADGRPKTGEEAAASLPFPATNPLSAYELPTPEPTPTPTPSVTARPGDAATTTPTPVPTPAP